MEKLQQIAIDGPAGAGKSSVAKKLAERLGYLYIDTGAMYRAITYQVICRDISLADSKALEAILEETELDFVTSLDKKQLIYCNGEDITEQIRMPQVSNLVSAVSALGIVRKSLVEKQQDLGLKYNIVMDGRDIGTVVLPNADFKFFLTASLEERTKRRLKELTDKGVEMSFEALAQEIASRDEKDSQREISPLVAASDALHIDTGALTLNEVVEKLFMIIKK